MDYGGAVARGDPPGHPPSDTGDTALSQHFSSPTYPRIPQGPRRRSRRGLRGALIALVAGFLGALLGTSVGVGLLRDPAEAPASQPLATEVNARPEIPAGGGTADLDSVADVAEAVLPSVVRINIGSGNVLSGGGNGSGVIYRSDGHIITNNHVVQGTAELEVVFADGETLPADVVGADALNDVAVVKVDRTELPEIPLGDSTRVRVGDLAVAVGSPFGLDSTVTAGVISARARGIQAGAPGRPAVFLDEVLQTDAPINPGNSGGALVNGAGQLIGINSAILTSGQPANAGVGFAIPVETVIDIADELIEQGFVRHPFLGVLGEPVTPPMAGRLGVDAGALISEVEPGTPAADAGLAPGDVVIAVQGGDIESMADLIIAIRDQEVGEEVTITYVRNGEEQTVQVVLEERPR